MVERIKPENAVEQAVDDFKIVNGIGPAVEKRLHQAGISTYAQLARVKPEKLARLLHGMVGYSTKRIKEQNWSSQARALAAQAGQSNAPETHERTNNSLHYASFSLELLLDRDNQVRRTRIMHVQTRQENTWAGWDVDRLCAFLVDNGQLKIAPAQDEAIEEAPRAAPASSPLARLEASKPVQVMKGFSEIVETRLMNPAGQPYGALIPGDQPFEVQLMLDLSKVEIPQGECLSYDATVYIKKIGKSRWGIAGENEGTLAAARSAVINVSSQPLAPGDYRLEALVALRPQSQPKLLKNQLMAMTESVLLNVVDN